MIFVGVDSYSSILQDLPQTVGNETLKEIKYCFASTALSKVKTPAI
jgi:hypothetical protein